MEFFLWFWLLDRRFFCNFRPILKYFSFLFLLPLSFHISIIIFNIYSLFPFKKLLDTANLIVAFATIFQTVLGISLIILIASLYNLSKKQPKRQNNIFILFFERIKNSRDENYVYYEDYWMGRTVLFSAVGKIVLLTSIINIIWSFYYVLNRYMFFDLFDWVEQFIFFYAYLNILFFIGVIAILFFGSLIKVSFALSAMICPKCILSLTDCCCKKNDGLNKTIDFSDVPRLEPEFI